MKTYGKQKDKRIINYYSKRINKINIGEYQYNLSNITKKIYIM